MGGRPAPRCGPGTRSRGSAPPPVSSRTVPATATRPRSMMKTWSASASASSIACVVSTTETPAARSSRSSCPGRAAGVRVHARRGLVEEHQLGPPDEGAGQVDGLLLAAGQPPVRASAAYGPMPSRATSGVDVERGGVEARRGSGAARRPGCPTRRRCSAASGPTAAATRRSSRRARPARGPGRRRDGPGRCSSGCSVVLPAPLGPRTAVSRPRPARSVSPESTGRPPRPTLRSSTASAASSTVGTGAV